MELKAKSSNNILKNHRCFSIETGIMTFKELLAQYCFAEIRHPFLCLWQTNEPKLVERLDLEKWVYIYRKVQSLEPMPSDYYIGLVSR